MENDLIGPEKEVDIFADQKLISINSCLGYRRFTYNSQGYKCCLSIEISNEELGKHILLVLKDSYMISLKDYGKYFNADAITQTQNEQINWLKKTFKRKSYKDLNRNTVYCSLSQEKNLTEILSYQRKNGENFGDESPENWTRISAESTLEGVGRAVKLALTKCRGFGTEEIQKKFIALGWGKV